tara:strand:+ start:865 stop:1968 length:1104 start_codon:yes stop_codon:yes gene_type:complete
MTDTQQLDSTEAGVDAGASIPQQPARPETVAETLAKTLQSFEGEAEAEEETLPEPPEAEEAEEAEEQPEEAEEAEQPDEADDEEEQQEAAELEALEAPSHWPKDFAKEFSTMPPEAQHLFMQRYKQMEGDYTQKTQGIAKYKKRQEQFDEIMQPFRGDFERAGMDDVAAIRQLLAAHDYLRKDPQNAISWLANQYGVDMAAVSNDPAAEDDYTDPTVKALQQQVAQLTGFIQNQQTQQQSQVQASTQSLIDQFAQEKDDKGNPAHPHFDAVSNHMGVLIQNNVAPDLATAYDMAVMADPKLRQEKLDSYAKSQAQTSVQSDAVAKAKKAQRSKVRGSAKPAAPALPANASIRDTIAASIRQLENGRS